LQGFEVRQHNENVSVYLFEDTVGYSVKSVEINIDTHVPLSQVIYNQNFLSGLSKAQSDLESSQNETRRNFQLGNDVAVSVSISTTAGVLAWMLRGGALFGSLMAATPLWSSVDPLRITKSTREDKEAGSSEVEDIFEN